ncbi:hypothetical protein CPB83DRAFT_867962 [Crepidotus variabilis]|uniref:RPA43 OB domain-containing protein n=1 Tax=Crepidotus variabilis TaxID=179855 RepID=A0A9P6ELZ9_9AGAR|nr:hypothetical protein CPB83DRAFT_867962 [Crepidotus variabilis]
MSKRKESTSTAPPTKKIKPDNEANSQFHILNTTLVLSVPPVFAADPRGGAQELLDSMLMRYIPSLQGVLLAHSNLNFINSTAKIHADCPFLICNVLFDATVWSPKIGYTLAGKINLSSPDHVALLVHKTFNVSIPRRHIPVDTWEFEQGPAENDPEFGNKDEQEEDENSTSGRWVHKLTGEPLGGRNSSLEFTVIGFTVANEMLSLLGSIQPDPFSLRHSQPTKATNEEESSDEEESAEEASESESSGSDEAVAV